jgi:hypothetical protein
MKLSTQLFIGALMTKVLISCLTCLDMKNMAKLKCLCWNHKYFLHFPYKYPFLDIDVEQYPIPDIYDRDDALRRSVS